MTYIWIISACVLFVAEMLTGGFALLAFGLGAVASAVCSAIGLGLNGQIGIFTAVSLLFFFFIRPLLMKWWKEHEKKIPQTNALGLIGKTAKVVETIDHQAKTGRVVIDGDNFVAISVDKSVINVDTRVEVVALDSTILIVKQQA